MNLEAIKKGPLRDGDTVSLPNTVEAKDVHFEAISQGMSYVIWVSAVAPSDGRYGETVYRLGVHRVSDGDEFGAEESEFTGVIHRRGDEIMYLTLTEVSE